jgi:hypothetical protein
VTVLCLETGETALEVARQEWHLARKHYQQIMVRWPMLPLDTRDQQIRAAADRRKAAFDRYMKKPARVLIPDLWWYPDRCPSRKAESGRLGSCPT